MAMQQPTEDSITIDGFTYLIEHMTPEQQNHAIDIRRAESLVTQHKFNIHVCEHYKQTLLDELGEMLKKDGKK